MAVNGDLLYVLKGGIAPPPTVHPLRILLLSEAIERAGLGSLNEGDEVSYEVVMNSGKESAENLRVG